MTGHPTRLFAFCLASIALIGPLAVHAYMPVIPAVKVGLGIPDALAQLSFSVALFGMAVATLVYGTLSDRFGRRPVLLSGLALFLLGSLVSFFATSIVPLVLGRLLQAIGAGCGMTLVRTIARDAYGPDQLVKVLAYLTMFYTIGPMVAPIATGFLVDLFGWRSVFAFALVSGGLIASGAWFVLYETKPVGSGLAAGASISQSYVSLFKHLRFTSFVCQTGFSTGAFMVTAAAASFIMKEMLDRPASEYGLWFTAFPIGFFLGNFVSSRLGSRAKIEDMVLIGSVLSLAAAAVMCVLLAVGLVSPLSVFLPGLMITFAQGLSLPYSQAGAMGVDPRLAGTASGIGVCLQNLCGFLTTQAYGMMADGTVWPLIITCGTSSLIMMGFGLVPWWLRQRAQQ
jgi:DHA1 family bicyclomycin/chloramphenicol resistance-like MFS transporter